MAGSDRAFAERYGPRIAALGTTPVPDLLLLYQGQLDLTPAELVYVLHVLRWRRESDGWPWLPVEKVAEATGKHVRNVRAWKESLVRKGYLVCTRRYDRRGRQADLHDLTPLLVALEQWATLEWQARDSQSERDRAPLPAPIYTDDTVPETPATARPTLAAESRRKRRPAPADDPAQPIAQRCATPVAPVAIGGENARGVGGENAPYIGGENALQVGGVFSLQVGGENARGSRRLLAESLNAEGLHPEGTHAEQPALPRARARAHSGGDLEALHVLVRGERETGDTQGALPPGPPLEAEQGQAGTSSTGERIAAEVKPREATIPAEVRPLHDRLSRYPGWQAGLRRDPDFYTQLVYRFTKIPDWDYPARQFEAEYLVNHPHRQEVDVLPRMFRDDFLPPHERREYQ